MKRSVITMLVLLVWGIVPQMVFSQEVSNGAFIAPVVKIGSVGGQAAAFAGVRGGWVINNRFVIGGIFLGLGSDVKTEWSDPLNGSRYVLSVNYGGLDLEYVFLSRSSWSASLELLMCGGGINYKRDGEKSTKFYGGDFSVWEPQLNADFILTGWLRLSAGAGYRIVRGLDFFPCYPDGNPATPAFRMKNLEGLSGIVALKIGAFR